MKNRFSHKQLLAPFLCVILSIPTLGFTAINSEKSQVQSVRIAISDLDLSQDEGVMTLYQRLKTNVTKVCGEKDVQVTGSRIASSKIKRQHRKCSMLALDNAVNNINNEKLTRLHQQFNS